MRKWLAVALLLGACGKSEPTKLSKAKQDWEAKRCLVSKVVDGRIACRFCQVDATPEQTAAAEADPRQVDFLRPYGGAKALVRGVEVCESK